MKSKIFTVLGAVAMTLATANAQIKVATESGDLSIRFMGRTNFDLGVQLGAPDSLSNTNGVQMNDTRLGVQATFDEKYSAKIEICYASSKISFRDLWVGYKLNDNNSIQVGHFFMPYGAKILGLGYKFVEDASIDFALCPSRKIGAALFHTSDNFNFTAGVFSDGTLDNGAQLKQGWTLSGKAIVRPIINDRTVLHFGAAPMFTHSPNDPSFTFKVPTPMMTEGNGIGKISSGDNYNYGRYEVEALFITGRFYSEFHYMGVNANTPGDDNFKINGFYGQASFLVIGDQAKYNKKTGLAAAPAPKSLEVLARVSRSNIQEDLHMTDLTIGANYFINKNLNFKLNFIHSKSTVDIAGGVDQKYNWLQGRLQFSF